MAYDINTAKRLAQQMGVQPPPGADYDTWVQEWFKAGVASGDPRLLKAAGVSQLAEGSTNPEDLVSDWRSAGAASDWMGKRNPTPAELRRYARESGWSEDFDRFSDRQLAAWIGKSWRGDHFVNDFGDVVEKPTESGAKSNAAGYATGEMSAGRGGGGGGGLGGGGVAAPAKPIEQPLWSPLQDMLANQGGFMSGYDQQRGNGVAGIMGGVMRGSGQGGGIWWAPTQPQAGATIQPSGSLAPITPGQKNLNAPLGRFQPGGLVGTMAPLQTGVTGGNPYTGGTLGSTIAPQQQPRPQGGLTGMLTNLSPMDPRRKRPNSWF